VNQKANRDFQAFAISGNSKGVSAANILNSSSKSHAFSQSFNIVSNAILVCSKSHAIFNQTPQSQIIAIPATFNDGNKVSLIFVAIFLKDVENLFNQSLLFTACLFIDSSSSFTSSNFFLLSAVHLTIVSRISFVSVAIFLFFIDNITYQNKI
jgi:hypothetical protein